MEANKIKPETLHEFTLEDLKLLLKGKQFREVIQYFIIENSKGENGLIVKKIRENHSKSDISFVENQIEIINGDADNLDFLRNEAVNIYQEFSSSYKKQMNQIEKDDHSVLAKLFLLLIMNYVFVVYKNKSFRKFIDVKKKSVFKQKFSLKKS